MHELKLPEPDFSLDMGDEPCYYAHTVKALITAYAAENAALREINSALCGKSNLYIIEERANLLEDLLDEAESLCVAKQSEIDALRELNDDLSHKANLYILEIAIQEETVLELRQVLEATKNA